MQFHDGNLMLSVDAGRLGPQPGGGVGGGAHGGAGRARSNVVPGLTDAQHRALDVLLAAATRHEVEVPLEPGDVLFFNNWAVLHRRDRYHDDATTSRHLVRLWLRNSELGWAIPPSMAVPWLAAFEVTSSVDPIYQLEPMPDYKVPVYSAGSAAFVLDDSDDGNE
jgi:hypothetical protein